jgi:tetratricopeptide (TPR) repeat protein
MAADHSLNQPDPPAPSGKAISPAARKRLQRCFERGQQLTRQEKPDYDYAHAMFSGCVLNDPGNLEYAEAMLSNLQRKYNNNKRGARLKGFGGRSAFKKAAANEDWNEVFRLGIELLQVNPWDVPTLRALALACKANHYNEVELRYLKNALDVNPKDVEVNQHCAESLTRMGQFDQAIACWHRIEELDRDNQQARKRISELTLAKTGMGLPGAETTGEKAARALPPSVASVAAKATPTAQPEASQAESADEEKTIGQLERALQQDPTDVDQYVELAARYTAEHHYREAYQTLKRGLEAAGGADLRLQNLLEDAQIRMVRAQLAIAEKRAASEPSPEATDLVRRFRAEVNRQELAVFTARSQRYPEDLAVRFELGVRLRREANYREAITAFEAARQEPARRSLATLEMGECFQQLKQYANALKCYQSAAADADPDSDVQKLALYRGGVLASALKNLEVAKEMLVDLVERDPDYRDAAPRLDKLRQMQDTHGFESH